MRGKGELTTVQKLFWYTFHVVFGMYLVSIRGIFFRAVTNKNTWDINKENQLLGNQKDHSIEACNFLKFFVPLDFESRSHSQKGELT